MHRKPQPPEPPIPDPKTNTLHPEPYSETGTLLPNHQRERRTSKALKNVLPLRISANYTSHPTLCTLPPTPYTPHPTPYTLHPAPYTLHPTPYTLHLTPRTLHPAT